MQQHWEAGNALQHAMVRGDLTSARRAATEIAAVQELQGISWNAESYLEQMREEAEAVRAAASFEGAAVAAGRMAAACGACHVRGETGPHPAGTSTAPSVDPDDTRYHMVSFAWAVDRMWEGLVVPSWDRWRAGARVLADSQISASGLSPEAALQAARIQEMGRQALDDDNTREQADRLGKILTDCAGCHAELGIH